MIQAAVDRAANNRAPVLTAALPGLQAYVGNAFSYAVPVNTITDPDAILAGDTQPGDPGGHPKSPSDGHFKIPQ